MRKYGFYYRYDTARELELLNQLWPLVNDQFNFFEPTKKPIGYATDRVGRRKRIYDTPRTPYTRLLDSGTLSPAQQVELTAYKASTSNARSRSPGPYPTLVESKSTTKLANPTRGKVCEAQTKFAGGIDMRHLGGGQQFQ